MASRRTPILLLTIAILSMFPVGCATKKYVRHRIDERVAPLENRTGELEETSRRNSADIQRLDGEVNEARARADKAQVTADAATVKAVDAIAKADKVNTRVDKLVENIDAYTLLKTVTVTFMVNRDLLDDTAISELSALVAELRGKKGYVLDIQGYTDATGADKKNMVLSDRRARAVYQYLAENGVPLFRMNLLGFGKGQPVADNDSREGRAQNRRVEVRVMVTQIRD
ncbi:MAG: OmpA family protein [Blastocatellia bacterium]|nr:OmpA family protein [Blastocatellia bacterium]